MAELRKTRNIVGNVPEPSELYGREGLVSHVWRQIEGNNILLLAPRRFGKTGVMRHILLSPRAGYLPLYFDLEDVDTPAEFLWRLTGEILKQAPLRDLIRGVRTLPGVKTPTTAAERGAPSRGRWARGRGPRGAGRRRCPRGGRRAS